MEQPNPYASESSPDSNRTVPTARGMSTLLKFTIGFATILAVVWVVLIPLYIIFVSGR